MDSCESFIEALGQAISTRDFAALTSILKSAKEFLAIISVEHREPVVYAVFDGRNSLLCFYNNEFKNLQKNRIIDNALTQGFYFLDFFIKNFYTTECFAKYILQIKKVCQLAMIKKCCYYIQKAACKAFTKLIELFRDHDLELTKTITTFVEPFVHNLYTKQERKLIFCVLSKIIKCNGNVCESQTHLTLIFQQLLSDVNEYVLNDLPNDFHIYFDVFADILDSIEPPKEIRNKLFCKFYEWIKNISQLDREQPVVLRSAIDLLSRHINLFQDYLYPDCQHWYNVLQHLSLKTTASGECGQRALKSFYRVIGRLLTERDSTDTQKLLVYFLEDFEKEFKNTNLDLISLQLVIYGFSQMAAPCKLHLDQFNIRHMYSIITSYALPLCSSEQSNSTHIENVCCYQKALAEILCHMTDVTFENINVLIKLSTYTIKRFPDLVVSNNALAVSALIKTMNKLGTINKNLLQQYLDNIIYDGIAWSCSHTLALDAVLQQELNNLEQSPICYKNYLPLWTELLNVERYLTRGCEQMVQHVANTLINVCITLIGRLDVRLKRTNEDTVYSDVALTQSALNQADFRVFTNLVDLYVDVIDASESSLFINTMCKFLYEIIKLSYRYPLISGFYKLVRTGMKVFVTYTLEEEENIGESQQMKELLSNYLTRTLDLIPTFSNELLITCLYLILDAPHTYFKDALLSTLPAFRIAFTVGLSNLELAYNALATLETWTEQERKQERTNELLREIVVYLEPYLRSTESSVEVSQDLTVTRTRSRVKRVEVIDTDCMLRNFQRRVLLFLGSLDHDLLSSFVHDRASRSTGASWDHKNLVKYTLPLPDARPDIHFDRMLPRIIALARESSDRRTKIAACEVLHSIVALIIGSTTRYLSNSENPFTALYGTLCPVMLVLGCDSDEVVRGLFQPLTLQLMHWLSSKLMLSSSLTPPVLDSLFNSLTDDSNPALREFSGMCLAEFTHWSIRQAQEERESQSNVYRIIRRINEFALHPSMRKRIAAAVAFNHLYAILRENNNTISIYWLEIFYCFVCSFNDECDDPSIANALAHVEKVMRLKADLLNKADPSRRKPHEFEGATLTHALYWLLSRCGTLDERCRAKCMELYVNISQCIDNYPQERIQIFIEIYGMDRLNDIVLRGLESGVKDISIIDNVTPFLKALDCYIWLIKVQLLSIETLFPATDDAREHIIFSCIRSFTRQLWRITTENFAAEAIAINSRELEQLQTLQCKTLMATLNFIQILLNINVNILPESLWDESLSKLMIKCIMFPRAVGFDVRNIEMTDKLPHILEIVLNTMKSRFTYLPNTFKNRLLNFGRKYVARLLNLNDIAQNNLNDDLIQHVKGLILLQRCNMLDPMILEKSAFENGEKTVECIFKFLVNERIGEWICSNLNARMIEYLRTLMEFQLSLFSLTIETPIMVIPNDVRSITETLVKLISNDTLIIGADSAQITHGEYFLNMFKDAVFRFMLTHVGAITLVFDEMSRDNPSFLLKWLEDLVLYLKQHKRELQAHVEATMNAILRHFMCLKSAACDNDSGRERLMNIYGIVVRLSSEPVKITRDSAFPELYKWILSQLNDHDCGLEYKIQILQRFFICLTDATTDYGDNENPELQVILQSLNEEKKKLCSNLSETSVNAMKVTNCFETLLMLVSTTRSKIILKCVIYFAAGTGDHLFQNEKVEEHLRECYREASSEHALRLLKMTYEVFMNRDIYLSEIDRLDVLRGFLLPTFKVCETIAIERFFEQNIRELHELANLRIDANTDNRNVKQILVSKIGCFEIITIMFASVDANKTVGVDATIALNALHHLKTGRELVQSLYKRANDTRALRITQSGCKELVRLLHCSAYNCELAIISLKEDEYIYRLVFAENDSCGLLIWKNIIDCSKRYQLGQTFKKYPKIREVAVNMKSTTFNVDDRYAYVHSYDLSASTLCEDINAYDFNRSVLLPFNRHQSTSARNLGDSHGASVVLESDDFNKHECMPYICVLLRRIREICVPNNECPKWLEFFLYALKKNEPNIRLFILRIIWNMVDDVFKPYARFMLTPIVEAVASYLEQYDLNYIITDILEMLINWHDVPRDENYRTQAQRLFEAFINKALVEPSNERQTNEQRVYDYNLSLIKAMVEKWHSYLRVPDVLLTEKMTSAPNAAVYLISVLLYNDMTEEIIARDDIVNFLLKPLRNWNISEKATSPCSECLGLYLKSLDKRDENERKIKNHEVREKIMAVLGFMQPYGNIIKQIKRVAVLCRNYPEVATDYTHVMLNAIAKNLGKDYCLEIFALSMSRLSASDSQFAILNNLRHIDLEKVLKNQQGSFCAKLALKIVGDLVTIISPSDLLPYVKSTIPYIRDANTEHRELVYDILMKVYGKYSVDTVNDDVIRLLLSISVENLLAGLLDPSQELQDRILRFWTEETRLSTERSKNRLLGLLTMHSMLQITTPEEDSFAPFIALLMLQLVTKSMDYNKNIFDAPLHNCTFENYKIAVSWRRRNLSCMTPMFVDSLASQMSYGTFSQISTDADLHGTRVDSYSHLSRFSGIPLRLRATQDLQFEPTLDDTEAADTTFDSEFDRSSSIASSSKQSLQDTTMRRRPFRILANSSDVANIIRRKQIQKNVQRREKMKQESIRQRSSIRLYRDYRIGDFPDIEIPHSSLIVPLQQLIKLDRLICKDMIVLLFCSLIEEMTKRERSDDFHQAVVDHLKRILHNSSEKDSSFNAVVLQTLLQLNVTDGDPRDIAKISKISRLDVLGALLLERSLLPDPRNDDSPTSSKRMRRCEETDNEETDKWVQLASLYKSLNDVDVILSIFRRQRFFGDDMQKAAFAEVNSDWIQAKDAYTSAYKQIENQSIKEHCFQGLFEAVENLCDWSAIDQLVKSRTNNRNLNGIWDDTWKDWMLPYAFDAYVHMLEERKWESMNDDLGVIQSWMDDRDKSKYLKHLIGTDLMIFLMTSEELQRHATDLLNELLDKTREQWVGLSPLCIERGIRESLKLQAMNDLNASLSVLRCTNEATFLNRLDTLLNFWSSKVPAVQDNLVQWNKLAAYRMYSSMLFENIFNNMKDDDEDRKRAVIERMHRSSPQLRLAISDAALHQKHRYIAEKHLSYMNDRLQEIYNPHLELPLELLWLEARIKCLHADIETDVRTKMSDYTASWEYSHRLLNECDELNTNTFIRQHVGVLASKIESSSRENAEFADALVSNAAILQKIGIAESTHVNLNNIREYLLRYSFNNLRTCCEDAVNTGATNVGEHYCALARHCYGRLMSTDVESDEIFHEFLLSTLRAMRYDYLEAAHYFPCLLKPERLQDEEMRVTFVRECAELQPWLFLRWQDLLFSHLGTSIASLVVPIVERLAEAYPDAVVYTYHLVIERNPSILQDGSVQRVHSLLRDKAEKYEQFLRAIQYVAQPELYLKHYLDEAMRDLTRGKRTAAIESLLQKVYPSTQTAGMNNPRPGNIYHETIAGYEREIRALNPDDLDATREGIRRLKKSLDESFFKRASKDRLNDYSPFLHEYMGGSIEIPGQYTDDRKPILRYHARIARFEPRVEVMQSLRKPIRISMVGDNGKEYKFLVKFGEDLTIDRGLQQLYTTMNRTLRNDASCRQRRLSIDTYEVIPLSRSFGLIQWIENTKSLEDLIHFTLSKKESDRCKSIYKRYVMWIVNASKKPQIADQYKEAVSKYSCRTVTEQMERFVGETRRTALRDALIAVSPSSECFATLRRNFVTSYATMCVAHWLAGVGDRHLQNTLVCVTTGRCLGIDFGHAFGGGMRTLVPEFVPFRLTPQILELLRPFTERDLLATIMTHTMRALRDDRGSILACMDIFVHKPVNRSSLDDETMKDDNQKDDADLTSLEVKRNIEIVAKKLNGIHPSLITLEQLKEAHDNEYFTRYHAIVIGDDGIKQARADMKDDCLTPAEQVDCLLDQAKDFNILGRMYAKWQSWL